MRKVSLAGIFLLVLALAVNPVSSQTFNLLKDINVGSVGSDPGSAVVMNGILFFVADDGDSHGTELWKSDGTAAGTVMVKDIYPNLPSSFPSKLTVMNGFVYFSANNGGHGWELWKTDGTTAGTTMVKDIFPGIKISSDPSGLCVIGNTLYFAATTGADGTGRELWKTDGTNAGTILVKDINPGGGDSNPTFLTNLNGTLIFAAANGYPEEGTGGNGNELWKSDGTAAGTVLVKNINTINSSDWISSSDPTDLFYFNNAVYFKARGNLNNDIELYKTNGTTAGTVLVKDIYPGHYNIDFAPGYGRSSDVRYITPMNGLLYFAANNGANGKEVWKSDGTGAGTVLVKDIYPGGNSVVTVPPVQQWSFIGYDSDPKYLCAWNDKVYFSATEPAGGYELWRTDGTSAGTSRVKNIVSGAGNSNPTNLHVSFNKLYFSANDGSSGNELWTSDGTAAGTVLLKDFQAGSGSSNPYILAESNNKIFVVATTSAFGKEIWVSNTISPPPPITANETRKNIATLYPNPVKGEILIAVSLDKKEKIKWQLTDNLGRVLKSGYNELPAGISNMSIDASGISSGSYVVQLNGSGLVQSIKIVKE